MHFKTYVIVLVILELQSILSPVQPLSRRPSWGIKLPTLSSAARELKPLGEKNQIQVQVAPPVLLKSDLTASHSTPVPIPAPENHQNFITMLCLHWDVEVLLSCKLRQILPPCLSGSFFFFKHFLTNASLSGCF